MAHLFCASTEFHVESYLGADNIELDPFLTALLSNIVTTYLIHHNDEISGDTETNRSKNIAFTASSLPPF